MRYLLILGAWVLLSWPAQAQHPVADSVSSDRFAAYTFANDAYFKTDYYFTQGMTGTAVLPGLRRLPGARLLRLTTGGVQHFGLRLHYDGFTPLRIQDAFIRRGDRPYAAYLYADYFRAITDAARHRRLTTTLSLGLVGPAAGAKGFQTKLHALLGAPTPRGWDYQIRNDLVLGYAAHLEQRLLAMGRAVELIGGGTAALSTLRTYAGLDARLRLGLLQPYFSNLGVASRANRAGQRRAQLYAEAGLDGRLVGYDATLQGGLLRRDNPYTLSAGALKRGVLRATGTLGLGYAGLRLTLSAVQISPEFRGARQHRWAQLGLLVAF
ncbi:lipid A deacylase LpxR family protein [Hymenobacter sp. 15J16-1T3B]|uniref:lipid A deacylase LpxR family protein n=1 Tax=Hymenobacter sp. 15J16-1T3B TaxID=2886941 RepID=UPI001D10D1B4|nr:lipid A deacylase LpxR family protein [Hymenobacter sp. 15J16-1T3B]MCC3155980.1 lipid A deacylase LpxR family protein [Hymenobacter sp. 15J16-1T3B]